jgi:ATP-binding cassette subfamily B protein
MGRWLTMGAPPDSREGILHGLHVLVVEDNRDAREILKAVLTYFGAFVTATPTTREALAALRHAAPSVVVTDMLLGTSDGLALLQQARKHGAEAPFIAVSGADFEGPTLESAGFAAYLRKPLDHNKLVDTILAVVRDR